MKKKVKLSKVIVFIILILIALSTIYPIIFMLVSSLKTKSEYLVNMFGLPKGVNFNNYRSIFKSFNIPRLMFNSFLVTSSAVLFGIIISSMAAFSLTKLRFKGKDFFFKVFMFVLLVPAQALMMPVYLTVSRLNMVNTYQGIILVYISTTIAFSTYLLVQTCKDIPDEMIEAARIDGASYPKVFLTMIIPMLKPTIATLAILTFLQYWNEIVYSRLVLQEAQYHTMTLGLMTLAGKYGTNMPLMMSGLMINVIPALMIFLIFNKYLSKGIAMGSSK